VRAFLHAPALLLMLAACTALVPRAASAMTPQPVEVMLVGDSLSVGPFGRALEQALRARYGRRAVSVFASCGSSPEDWLPGQPVFVTNCGYRQSTPGGSFSREYENGKRPPPVKTPKLTTLLGHVRPRIVIVQLGTNWMDKLAAAPRLDGRTYRKFIRGFIAQLRRGPGPRPAIFWVMPPASSKYPPAIHDAVERWIAEEAAALGFYTVDSRALTSPYRDGRTGGDGVHYGDAAGQRWARGVMGALGPAFDRLSLAPRGAAR
jgi:lysophospholipase L1-like esterase